MIAVQLALAAAIAAAPADKSEMSVSETRKMLAEYGTCIIKSRQKLASAAILANVDNSSFLKDYERLIDGSCLPRSVHQVKFAGDQYRYALADALVRAELAELPAPSLDSVPRLDHREPGEPPPQVDEKGRPISAKRYAQALERHEQAKAFAYLSRYGECVVRVNPEAARALLATAPQSAEEKARFTAMERTLGECLRQGETLAMSKAVLRGTIAVNYYRLAKSASRLPAAGEAR